MTPRYFTEKCTYAHIPRLIEMQEVEAAGSELSHTVRTVKEWEHIIDTYEHAEIYHDKQNDDFYFGYMIAAQVQNSIWIREIYNHADYRGAGFKELSNWDDNRPVRKMVMKAHELGGICIAPVSANNKIAIGAITHAYNFRVDREIEDWYGAGNNLAICIEDTGTEMYTYHDPKV